jgi:hypothetical protein
MMPLERNGTIAIKAVKVMGFTKSFSAVEKNIGIIFTFIGQFLGGPM